MKTIIYESFDDMEKNGLVQNILDQPKPTIFHMKVIRISQNMIKFAFIKGYNTSVLKNNISNSDKLVLNNCYMFLGLGKALKAVYCTTTGEKL